MFAPKTFYFNSVFLAILISFLAVNTIHSFGLKIGQKCADFQSFIKEMKKNEDEIKKELKEKCFEIEN